jgi:hypothetical protein
MYFFGEKIDVPVGNDFWKKIDIPSGTIFWKKIDIPSGTIFWKKIEMFFTHIIRSQRSSKHQQQRRTTKCFPS